MSLSENRIVYGIHSICPFSRTTGEPFGILKVLGGGTLALSAEYEDLFGGSNKFAWATEAKTLTSEFTANVKSVPDFLFELFLGATVSTTGAAALGTVSSATDVNGTLVDTVGIASVGIITDSEADLKDTKYLIKAVGATTVDVFAYTDVSFAKGTDLSYQNDLLKITASPLTIVTDTEVEIPNTGIEITGGSGTIAMDTGDTAEFHSTAAHAGISEIVIGSSATEFVAHGQVCLAAKRNNGDLFEIEIYNAVAAGFPIALEETTFSIPELTVKLQYDSVKDAVAKITATKGV